MRLVVDLQACQTDSRYRGIGRYAISLVQAIASELGESDELILAIDMAVASRARDLRNELRRRAVHARVVGYGYPTTRHTDADPAARKLAGQLRARFYASLHPDALLICSFIETGEPFSTELDWAVLKQIPTAVICYDLIPLLFADRYLREGYFVTGWYRQRLEELSRFDLILSISEATKRDLVDHLQIATDRIVVIGAGFDETLAGSCNEADGQRRLHELGIERPFVLMVGNGDWRKNTLGALRAFADLPKDVRDGHDLVLTQAGDDVRQAIEGEYAHLGNRVHVLGRVDDATLALLYGSCRVLYFPSHYEGFGLPVLEAMAFNAPVLSSSAGALPEVVHDVRVLFDPDSQREGVALLARTLTDTQFRAEIQHGAREHALQFTWQRTAHQALKALRALAAASVRDQRQQEIKPWPLDGDVTLMADVCLDIGQGGDRALAGGLRAIARGCKRRVLVDLTEIARLDAKTGIQRVTKQFFTGLATIAGERGAFDVEPFCWTERGIFYAREFARNRLGVPCIGSDTPVRIEPSDLVFMLDSSWWSPERFDDFHACVHAAGGEVVWMVHDLIPIRFPETCEPGMDEAFERWLKYAVLGADGFVCNSEATRCDLEAFVGEAIVPDVRRPWTRSVHLGCDFDPAVESHPSNTGMAVRAAISGLPYFAALGTIEPRKDYQTILTAFEMLWKRGMDVALVIIGKQGWNVEALVERISRHPEQGRRLFWLQEAGDGDVRYTLEGAAALIQASIWEGFGLPLIEAASMDTPLLVSDIAVFHEIAGEAADYFPVGDAVALADAVTDTVSGKSVRRQASIPQRSWNKASLDLANTLVVSLLAGGKQPGH